MQYRGQYGTYEVAKNISVEMGDRPFSIDVKRFSMPVVLKYTCPHCGKADDFEPDYFGYPTANAIQWEVYECQGEGCAKEIAIPVFVECRARVATEEEIAAAHCAPRSDR